MNKIEDEEIYAVPNNDLEEDNKISFSVKQEPSIPVLKSFILEGLKPESVVKKEPVEITVPGVKSEKKNLFLMLQKLLEKHKFLMLNLMMNYL